MPRPAHVSVLRTRDTRVASRLESGAKAVVLEVQEYVRLLGKVARAVVTPPVYYRDIVEQFDSIGIGSLTVVLLAGLFTGMVLALNSGVTLDQFGARSMVGRLISASMVKELGPVLTGLMVSGRVGSGIASWSRRISTPSSAAAALVKFVGRIASCASCAFFTFDW